MIGTQVEPQFEEYEAETLEIEEFEVDEPFTTISYARADKKRVYRLLKELQKEFRVWCDIGIEDGDIWPEAVAGHIKKCSCVIVFLSPLAIASQNVCEEIHYARTLNKEMLIVFLEECQLTPGMEMRLGHIQSIMAYSGHGKMLPDNIVLNRLRKASRLQTSKKKVSTDALSINRRDG